MGRLVNAVLDMAERMAKRHIPMTMEDWAKRIDIILEAGGECPGVQVPKGMYHTCVCLVPGSVIFEAKDRPYDPLLTEDII